MIVRRIKDVEFMDVGKPFGFPEGMMLIQWIISNEVGDERYHHSYAVRKYTLQPGLSFEKIPFHNHNYVRDVKRFCSSLSVGESQQRVIGSDNWLSQGSFKAACYAVGAAVSSAKLSRKGQNSFAVVRPPGHHAYRDQGNGFCIFNNIAIATEYLRRGNRKKKKSKEERIMIVDLDLHLGDGTLSYAQSRKRVFYFSINHEGIWPHYKPDDTANTENIFLPEGTNDQQYIDTLESRLIPTIRRFKPTIIAISMGFDTYYLDHEEFGEAFRGGFDLTQTAYKSIREIIYETAIPHFYVLEGGYHQKSVQDGLLSICDWD